MIGRQDLLLVAVLSFATATPQASADDGMAIRHYSGSREVRYAESVGATRAPPDYDDTYRATEVRSETRAGTALTVVESRRYEPRAGAGRGNAAASERVVSYERLADDGARIELVKREATRSSFAHERALRGSFEGSSPFDGSDLERSVETSDTPVLVWTSRTATESNAIARSLETSVFRGAVSDTPDGSMSERVDVDGSVRTSRIEVTISESLAQHPDGSGTTSDNAPGFYSRNVTIGTPKRYRGRFVIPTASTSTGRTIGDVPVEKSTDRWPDWYPGGGAFQTDADVLTSSDGDDTPVPDGCGTTNAGRMAHLVRERFERTRIDGTEEVDSDETYSSGLTVICTVALRRQKTFAAGRLVATKETTTVLGLDGGVSSAGTEPIAAVRPP